jgi:hypothetical protein
LEEARRQLLKDLGQIIEEWRNDNKRDIPVMDWNEDIRSRDMKKFPTGVWVFPGGNHEQTRGK